MGGVGRYVTFFVSLEASPPVEAINRGSSGTQALQHQQRGNEFLVIAPTSHRRLK
jgi:hypothetical protein